MSIQSAVYERLTTHSGTAALVGARVYPQVLPQTPTYPAITYQRVSGGNMQSLAGPTGLGHPRVQIDCWAKTQAAVLALAKQVRIAFDGWNGSAGGVTVRACMFDQERDFYEPETSDYRVSMDFIFFYDE